MNIVRFIYGSSSSKNVSLAPSHFLAIVVQSPPSETLVHLKDVNCFQLRQEKEFVCDRRGPMSCEALAETGSSL